ncbi:MAG TPA: recombinase zinc beta ribbon domain-containing protein [Actinomycetes bacterium]|nr:recombinase zinc beta ribbon domain-containing protein [Actinomycetes bacterium]
MALRDLTCPFWISYRPPCPTGSTPESGERRSGRQGPGNLTGRGTSPETAARFLLSGQVWCDRCGERVGIKSPKPGRRNKDKYRCRGRRMGKCDLPPIDREMLDSAVLDHLRDRHMDVVDVRRTVERERDRLLALRDDEAGVVADELAQVEADLVRVRTLARKAQQEYEVGELSAKLYSRLDAEYEREQAGARPPRSV